AENLARMGFSIELMAPLGNDGFAAFLENACRLAGLSLRHAPRLMLPSSVYLCLMDAEGDMHAAINDMALCEALAPDMLDMEVLNSCSGALLDANLPRPVLERVAREASVPLIADPVSVAKAPRLLPLLPRLAAFKPNLLEAQALTGESDPARCARALCRMGVRRAFVSAGLQGMYYCWEAGEGHVNAPDVTVVNATGAGDSAAAAIAAGTLLGLATDKTACLACRVAALTLQAPSAVSPALSADVLDHVDMDED
ncbi:MAG: hypothetical protein EOM66_02220, partial [Clostridia bacterium]|nr:hypothetical protein [Clostridia bacterium]